MLASGNSEVGACAHCLVSAMQREIPFARSKGIDPSVYDVPFNEAETYLDETSRDVLGAYEPRIDVERVLLEFAQGGDDGTQFTVTLADSGGDINDDDDEGDDD